jgi:hypothetical protein
MVVYLQDSSPQSIPPVFVGLLAAKAVNILIYSWRLRNYCPIIAGCYFPYSQYHTPSHSESQYTYYRLQTLTLSLLMSRIYGAPCKAINFNVVYIWTYVWQRWKPSLFICCTMFQHWINTESYPVSQLCANTLPAIKITLITNGI